MSIRLKCRSCQTAFVTSDDRVGRVVECPKCGAEQRVPNPAAAGSARSAAPAAPQPAAADPAPDLRLPDVSEASVFVPAESRRIHWWRWAALAVLLLLLGGATGVVVAWPKLRAWRHPVPPDAVEIAAENYLKALTTQDTAEAHRLGTIEEPPAISSFHSVKHDAANDVRLKGSFAPIGALHGRIDKKYTFDPNNGRFQAKDKLGPAAELADALHDAKEKNEQNGTYKNLASGDPEEMFDAIEQFGKSISSLAEAGGPVSMRRLMPTYKQLVEDSKPPLPPDEKELALDFAENREQWDGLLKRPFVTLKADGPYVLEQAEVTALVVDRLGSMGDPPKRLRLKLVRFRLEGIDTGWKVVSAEREDPNAPRAKPAKKAPPPEPAPEPKPDTPKGEYVPGKGFVPEP
jgi:hypothetical protein